MRTTKASAAVERLRQRSGNAAYSMSARADGLFSLLLTLPGGATEVVNGVEAAKPKPVSKLDVAFRNQLKRS